jgi:hypothetical protein
MDSLTQFAQYVGPTLAAVYLVVSGFATLFAILAHVPGGFGAFCGKVASALGTVALDVNKLIGLVKPMFGKGAVKVAGATFAVLALFIVACTSQQAAEFVSIESAACLAEETIASVIPPGSISQAAADIALVCKDVPVGNVVAFITQFLANTADAGAPAVGGPYVASPHVRALKAAIAK